MSESKSGNLKLVRCLSAKFSPYYLSPLCLVCITYFIFIPHIPHHVCVYFVTSRDDKGETKRKET